LKYAAKGNASNLGGFIPTGGYGHNPDLSLYAYDTAKAQSLLKEAGYASGFNLKIVTTEAWELEAQIIGCSDVEEQILAHHVLSQPMKQYGSK